MGALALDASDCAVWHGCSNASRPVRRFRAPQRRPGGDRRRGELPVRRSYVPGELVTRSARLLAQAEMDRLAYSPLFSSVL